MLGLNVIGIAFGGDAGILCRLECHRRAAINRNDYDNYVLFFNDLLSDIDLTIHYTSLPNYPKADLLEIERQLIRLYLPVWEFPFHGIAQTPDTLLKFGKVAQEYAEKKINPKSIVCPS